MKFIPLRTLRDHVKENGLNREILTEIGVVQELHSSSDDDGGIYYNQRHGFPKEHCVVVKPATDETVDLSKIPMDDFKDALDRIVKPFIDSYTECGSRHTRAGEVYNKMTNALSKVRQSVRRYSQVSRLKVVDKIIADAGLTDEQIEASVRTIGNTLRSLRDRFNRDISAQNEDLGL